MYTFSPVPFVGLGFLVVGLFGFIALAAFLGTHLSLLACVIAWYVLVIPSASFVLYQALREARIYGRMRA